MRVINARVLHYNYVHLFCYQLANLLIMLVASNIDTGIILLRHTWNNNIN